MGSEDRVDLTQLKEALGTIVASYTYLYDPYAILKEADIVMRYEVAMIDALGKLDKQADEKHTYRQLFKEFRQTWARALNKYNQITGDWKDSWIDCSQLLENLMRIAVKEDLIELDKEMLFNVSSFGVGGVGAAPAPPGGSGGDDGGEGVPGAR